MFGHAIASVDPLEQRHRQVLKLLNDAGPKPVAVGDLVGTGIVEPASTIYELELYGYTIEHICRPAESGRPRFVGYRLVEVPEVTPAQESAQAPPTWAQRMRVLRAHHQ